MRNNSPLSNKGLYIESSTMIFGEYLNYWLDNYARPNASPKTYEGYESVIRAHISPALGRIELSKLLPLHLQNYYTNKLQEGRTDGSGGLSAQTVRHHHRLISKALTDAVKWQFVIRNVAQAVNPPKPKKQEMITLNAEQVTALLYTAKPSPYYLIIYPTDLTRAYNKLIAQANVPPVRFHDLRHTHATLMLKQGIHPKIVSERLGHSIIGITLDTYTHLLPNMQKEAADHFDQLLHSSEM